jgi:hypothetical protein
VKSAATLAVGVVIPELLTDLVGLYKLNPVDP